MGKRLKNTKQSTYTVSHCTFDGGPTVSAVQALAKALEENARAIGVVASKLMPTMLSLGASDASF